MLAVAARQARADLRVALVFESRQVDDAPQGVERPRVPPEGAPLLAGPRRRDRLHAPPSMGPKVLWLEPAVARPRGKRVLGRDDPDHADRPGERGMLVELAERGELREWIEFVVKRGWSPSMHAIGDAAARLALDACDHAERVARGMGVEPPEIRIEHCQTVDPADIPRFGPSNRHASMQPTHMLDDGITVERSLGPARLDAFFPFRAIHDAGGTLSFGSDWPIESPDPIEGIRVAVTGRDRNGRTVPGNRTVDVATAIEAYTVNPRRALGLPPVSMQVGDPAELVVLDRDPRDVDWTSERPVVRATVHGGRVTHHAPA